MAQEVSDAELLAARAKVQQLQSSLGVPSASESTAGTWWSATNAMTGSALVLIFGLLVLLLITYLVKAGKDPEAILRLFGTVLVLVVAVFLVVAGYSNNQIAPVIGLLGTIAGYLLGKDSSNRTKGATESTPQ